MDRLIKYRELIERLLIAHADLMNRTSAGDIEAHVIFDQERDRYMLFRIGWWRKKRVHTATLYIRLCNEKIWIEEDWTEDGIATELLAAGVPKENIVLGFRHPQIRPYTEFAVA